MEVRVTGPGGLITDVYQIFLNADVKLLVGTVILVLVLLLAIYRSPVLPFVPLLAVGFGYFVAGGILALVAEATGSTLSGHATSLMVILLFGAGTDYGLLLISRYREELRREGDARVALATALGEKHFPKGSLAPTTVLIQSPEAPPEFVTGMITGALNEAPGVAAAFSTGTADDGRLLSFQIILDADPYPKEALQQVRDLREVARETAAAGGGTALVRGPTAIQADTWALSNHDTLLVAAIALVVVGVILAILLRALVAPFYLLLTSLLSHLAALGLTIFITEVLLGWERISYRIPLYMFIFLLALGSDYNIFITTRIRGETLARGLRDGTVKAVTATGDVLMSAGIILAGTFLTLLSQPVKDLAEISIGVALGVLIDTFLVRTALVPGLTLWVGPRAGRPGRLWDKSDWPHDPPGGPRRRPGYSRAASAYIPIRKAGWYATSPVGISPDISKQSTFSSGTPCQVTPSWCLKPKWP